MATQFQELALITPVSLNYLTFGNTYRRSFLQDELSLRELYKEVSYSRAAALSRLKYYERNVAENPACAPLFAPEVATLRAKLRRIDSLFNQAQSNGMLPVYPRASRPYKVSVGFIRSFNS